MTLQEYLLGLTGYSVPQSAVEVIGVRRQVVPAYEVGELDERTLDLCSADLYMWCATTPSIVGKTEDADGQWKHVDGGVQTTNADKRQLRALADALYAKWGESVSATSKIKIHNW